MNKLKMKPFCYDKFLPGVKLVTRDGKEIKVFYFFSKKIVVEIDDEISLYDMSGKIDKDIEHDLDLFMVNPEDLKYLCVIQFHGQSRVLMSRSEDDDNFVFKSKFDIDRTFNEKYRSQDDHEPFDTNIVRIIEIDLNEDE